MDSSSRLETLHEQTINYLKRFSFEDLRSFTNDFDTKVGSGGFGVVFKGEFPNGLQIAVKVLNEHVAEHLFMDEVRIMGITYHHCLVKFLGYCSDTDKKCLVYEYMENGSLDLILHKKDHGIEWDKLYDIMIETANGISYLHGKRIIHHDVKPANILLDSKCSPKVADFGLAKLINRDVTHVTVTLAKGTPGYVAPEMWIPISQVTHKCDVYSFGMMLFDVLGKSNINQNKKSFLEIVWEGFRIGQLDKIIEDCGIQEKNKERATVLSMVALWCAQYTPKTRPEMSEVVKMLKQEIQVMTPPNPLLPSKDSTTQSSREWPQDETSEKEMVDEIPTQPENEDVKVMSEVEPSNNLARYDFVTKTERDEIILKNVMQYHGFSNGIPVAAFLMYKWFLQLCQDYRLHVEHDPNAKLDRLIKMIDSAIEQQGVHVTYYWLSTTSMLMFFLERGFKVKKSSFSLSSSRMVSGIFPSYFDLPKSVSKNLLYLEDVDSFYPALAFKANLRDCLKKAYRIIREKLTEDLRSSLSLCIQAPTTTSWRADWKASVAFSSNNSHWKSIISTLSGILKKFQDNHVSQVLISKVFSRAFYYINVQLFNSLMTKSECCTLSYGEYLKLGLYELEDWCYIAKNYVGSSWDQLKHTRQAVKFLVTVNKSAISVDDLTKSLCPGLNTPQLYRICSVYWDNEDYTHGVSSHVLDKMRILWEDDLKNSVSGPLLLEESSDFLSFDDIYWNLKKMEFSHITRNVDIVKHPEYFFLKW